jgi:predicted nucleic acid-binding protein
VILIDTNIPMYLIGKDEFHKARTARLLDRVVTNRERLVTDVEVFQEILHRYAAIDRRGAIQPAFALLHGIVDEIFSIGIAEVESAKTLVLGYPQLSARDALHVAVMQEHGVGRIMSFDGGFDAVPGIQRLSA